MSGRRDSRHRLVLFATRPRGNTRIATSPGEPLVVAFQQVDGSCQTFQYGRSTKHDLIPFDEQFIELATFVLGQFAVAVLRRQCF